MNVDIENKLKSIIIKELYNGEELVDDILYSYVIFEFKQKHCEYIKKNHYGELDLKMFYTFSLKDLVKKGIVSQCINKSHNYYYKLISALTTCIDEGFLDIKDITLYDIVSRIDSIDMNFKADKSFMEHEIDKIRSDIKKL